MRLHGYFRSSSSYRCRIALNLKGIAYEQESVHLINNGGEHKSAAYKALNPQMLVPTLEVDDLVLTQSPAILEWLEEVHPTPALLPDETTLRAHVRAFCAVIACEIHPLQNLRVLQYIKGEFDAGDEGAKAWCQRWIGDGLAAAEGLLQKQPEQDFAFGDTPGMAEVYLMPQVYSAERFGVDMAQFPRLNRIAERCNQLSAFEAAHPSVQPDAS